MRRGRQLPVLLLVAALTGCAGLAFHRVFGNGSLIPVVGLAALVPPALTLLWSAGSRRISLWLVAPASIAAWLVVVSATLLRADAVAHLLPGPVTVQEAVTGARDSWYQILTTILPMGAAPQPLVAVHALVWLAATIAAEIAVRTRAALPLVLPSLGLLILATPLGVGGPGGNLTIAVAWLACAAVVPGVRAWQARPRRAVPWRARVRGRAVYGLLVAGVLVVAVQAAPLVTTHRPFDPRHYVTPAAAPRTVVNPLDEISAWLATPDTTLFTVRSSAPMNWRIAVLDDFDGRTWATPARYVVTGARVPDPVGQPANPARVQQDVTINSLTGAWIPAAAQPVQVSGTPVLVDPATGNLLSGTGLHPDLSYQVISAVPQLDADQLRQAVPATDDPTALALPPGLPPLLAAAAQQATAGASFPFQQATRLEEYLRSSATYDVKAPPGHSYGHLAYFLGVSRRGTSEQFATAFAVMARSLGLPTRVVVGFRPGIATGDGAWVVRGSDAVAWPEIDFGQLGWVPFYPTPDEGGSPAPTDETPLGTASQRRRIDTAMNDVPVTKAEATGSKPNGPTPARRTAGIGVWTVLEVCAGVLVVGYLLGVLLVPALRTRRRRRSDGGTRLATAAWADVVGLLRPLGMARTATLTTAEIAGAGARRLGQSAEPVLTHLAGIADAAAFSDRPVDLAAGRSAWADRDALAVLTRRAGGPLARLGHRLHPSVLFP